MASVITWNPSYLSSEAKRGYAWNARLQPNAIAFATNAARIARAAGFSPYPDGSYVRINSGFRQKEDGGATGSRHFTGNALDVHAPAPGLQSRAHPTLQYWLMLVACALATPGLDEIGLNQSYVHVGFARDGEDVTRTPLTVYTYDDAPYQTSRQSSVIRDLTTPNTVLNQLFTRYNYGSGRLVK